MMRLQERGQDIPLPDAGPAAHLVGYLLDAGPLNHGPMGATPLSHQDLAAWQGNTGIELSAWEARTLRALSADWLDASHAATNPDAPAPWVDPQSAARQAVSDSIRSLFGSRARTGRKASTH